MKRVTPISTRTDTPFPYRTLVRSRLAEHHGRGVWPGAGEAAVGGERRGAAGGADRAVEPAPERGRAGKILGLEPGALPRERPAARLARDIVRAVARNEDVGARIERSEEHTSELQSLMRISYAVFCLKKKTTIRKQQKRRNMK